MDFGFSSEQEQLRESVRAFLTTECPPTYARSMMDDPRGFTDVVWNQMAELGWLGISVPEAYGGLGLGSLDTVLLAEAMGAVVLPGPFFSTVCLGLPLLVAAGSDPQKDELLPRIVSGSARLTVAHAEASGLWSCGEQTTRVVPRSEGGFRLDGEKLFVPDARVADEFLVVADVAGSAGVVRVRTDLDGVAVEPMHTVDATRKLDVVRFDNVAVGEDALLTSGADAAVQIRRAVDVAKVHLAAEMCGGAERALELSVEYSAVREQFGRSIGSFQSIQHRCADMKVDLENAKSLVYYAAWNLDEGSPDASRACSMAKAYASEVCPRIVGDAIQIHGGIGFTWEHDLQLYYKRVKASAVTFGDARSNREAVASDLLD